MTTATLYRMHTDKHICPFGLRAKHLLEQSDYELDDNKLSSRSETDQFKAQHSVETTPQIFIGDERIGGYEELREYLGKPSHASKRNTYWPVLSIFLVSLLLAVTTQLSAFSWPALAVHFVGFAMVLLAVQKIRDVHSFSNSFITYDLLAMRKLRYAYVYPYVELYAGLGMLAALPALYYAPLAIFIGLIGGVSVFKAVYIDKRELKCACVGGDSDVPLGFISLTENVVMFAAGFWMLFA